MSFDVKKVKDEIVAWIRDWFEVNGKGCNAVVAISGGKDSSVVAALCVEALGKERVIGVLLPKGEQFDIDVSYALVEHLGIQSYTINIKNCYDGLVNELHAQLGTSADGGNLRGCTVQQRSCGEYLQFVGGLGRLCN